MDESSPVPTDESAFILINLLVVVVTIGIIAAIAVPTFNGVLERARVTNDLSNLRQIGAATPMCNRTKINALCAEWHVETMRWSATGTAFTNTATTSTDADGAFRWSS
jgi:Tfp pilus assembly protein FimT